MAWRNSHRDFTGHSFEKAGVDWPIDYPDLAPYYDELEEQLALLADDTQSESGLSLLQAIFFYAKEKDCPDARRATRRRRFVR